jgi:hypothetical protein
VVGGIHIRGIPWSPSHSATRNSIALIDLLASP